MLSFHVGEKSYPLIIKEGALKAEHFLPYVQGRRCCIITDETLAPLYGQKLAGDLEAGLITVPAGEQSKSLESATRVFSQLAGLGLSRSDLIIALGGGVVGDLAGWCAASYLRGVDYIQAPTTLLAQIDSSMGGKVGVNIKEGKNLVGAFHHPKAVFIDPLVLGTLPQEDFTDGLAEMIKYGFISDVSILEDMEALGSIEALKSRLESLIKKCCTVKKMVVEQDEKDTGLRMTLNFGHTLGHAIEKHLGLSHGRSVALGMVLISQIAQAKGLISASVLPRLTALLKQYGLPYQTEGLPPMSSLLPYVGLDKKNMGGKLHLILTPEAGKSLIHPADLSFFGGAL